MINPRYSYDDNEFSLRVASSKKSYSYLNRAAKIAVKSQCGYKVGALIVRGGSVLASGYNKIRNDLNTFEVDPENTYVASINIHAEISALARVKNARGATIYVTRIDKMGNLKNAKPCIDCAKALDEAGVSKVFYVENELLSV